MKQILDLHIHSKYSRACSKQLTLKNIHKACQIKGIDIISTGDFTHPSWFKCIKEELIETNSTGLYNHQSSKDTKIKFILGSEVSLIYKDNNKARRIHLCLHAPNIKAVKELNNYLEPRFNIHSDGRPILGIAAPEFVRICLKINPEFIIYPAHIWTPWFSMFGSKSGFNKLTDCFHEQSKHIHAYETGLSSDPEMNWQVSQLDNLTLLSNSDAHSLQNIGREANIFDLKKISYKEIYNAIKNKDLNIIKSTIEFFPEEGTYHIDGHSNCNFSCTFTHSKKINNTCPKCKKPLIIGVENRLNQLANKPKGSIPKNSYPFKKTVGLNKIIADGLGIKNKNSKKVNAIYNNLISKLGNEISILTETELTKINKFAPSFISQGIKKVRENKLTIKPGFDGQYGEIKIFSKKQILNNKKPLE